MIGSGKGADIPIALNRGASGIDGLIATACGFSSGINRPVSMLVGDLSAMHDLNSFKLLSLSTEPVFVVLLNPQLLETLANKIMKCSFESS